MNNSRACKFLLLCVFVFLTNSSFASDVKRDPAWNIRWSPNDRAWVRKAYDHAWQHAVEVGAMSAEQARLPLGFYNERPWETCRGLVAGFSAGGEDQVFCTSFILENEEYRIFIISHEIGHIALGHLGQNSKNIEDRIQQECEANVFAAEILGNEFVERALTSGETDATNVLIYDRANSAAVAVLSGKQPSCMIALKETLEK